MKLWILLGPADLMMYHGGGDGIWCRGVLLLHLPSGWICVSISRSFSRLLLIGLGDPVCMGTSPAIFTAFTRLALGISKGLSWWVT
jgi:hypothetical protein